MKKKILFAFITLLTGFILGMGAYSYIVEKRTPQITLHSLQNIPSSDIEERNDSFSQIVAAISPSVVNISAKKRLVQDSSALFNDPLSDLFSPFKEKILPNKRKEQSLGSGVITSQDGFIMTNYHVIEDADEIKVTLFNKVTYEGKIIGADPKTDIAIIKIDAENLPVIQWVDSDSLQVGEFVLAIGNPFGLSHTVTMGIISAVGRANVGIADYEDFIQTDAAINPGNSGGPLVNVQGKLIGINTAIFSRSGGYQGIGFAVPSNMAKSVFDQLVSKGKVIRGWIGVSVQDLTPELVRNFNLPSSNGALVSDVIKNSPAEKAGIQRGDVIVSLDGRQVGTVPGLRNMVAQSRIGSEVKLAVIRQREMKELKVVIVELPKDYFESGLDHLYEEEMKHEVLEGITVMELSRNDARQLGLGASEKGVVIINIEPGSSADDAGLMKGDVIQEIEGHTIKSLDDFNAAALTIKDSKSTVLFVNRSGKKFFVALTAS